MKPKSVCENKRMIRGDFFLMPRLIPKVSSIPDGVVKVCYGPLTVKRIGNSGMLLVPREHIGRTDVYVVILSQDIKEVI